MSTFQVDQLDHVELFVPSRHEAAAWYRRVLGLEMLSEYDSVYFSDPYGHQFEVTTYDHEEVETGLVVLRGQLHSNAHQCIPLEVLCRTRGRLRPSSAWSS